MSLGARTVAPRGCAPPKSSTGVRDSLLGVCPFPACCAMVVGSRCGAPVVLALWKGGTVVPGAEACTWRLRASARGALIIRG